MRQREQKEMLSSPVPHWPRHCWHSISAKWPQTIHWRGAVKQNQNQFLLQSDSKELKSPYNFPGHRLYLKEMREERTGTFCTICRNEASVWWVLEVPNDEGTHFKTRKNMKVNHKWKEQLTSLSLIPLERKLCSKSCWTEGITSLSSFSTKSWWW